MPYDVRIKLTFKKENKTVWGHVHINKIHFFTINLTKKNIKKELEIGLMPNAYYTYLFSTLLTSWGLVPINASNI